MNIMQVRIYYRGLYLSVVAKKMGGKQYRKYLCLVKMILLHVVFH